MARNNNNFEDFFNKFLGIKSVFQIAFKKEGGESIEMQMLKMTKSTPSIHVFSLKKKFDIFIKKTYKQNL